MGVGTVRTGIKSNHPLKRAPIQDPKRTPEKHNTKLPITLTKARPAEPFRYNSSVSKLKAEKVVKAPRKPIEIKGQRVGSAGWLLKYSKKIPIAKQPTEFTIKVEMGNEITVQLRMRFEIPNLAIAPKKPPNPTSKIFVIRFELFCPLVFILPTFLSWAS